MTVYKKGKSERNAKIKLPRFQFDTEPIEGVAQPLVSRTDKGVVLPTIKSFAPIVDMANSEASNLVQQHLPASQLDPNQEIQIKKRNIDEELAGFRSQEKAKIDAELKSYRTSQMANIDQERKAAIDKSYEEGKAKADLERDQLRARLESEAKALGDEFTAHIDSLSAAHREIIENAKESIIDFAFNIADRIVKTELTKNPDVIQTVVEEALKEITDKERVIVKVHPDDAESLQNHFEAIRRKLKDIKHLEIKEDKHLQKGGCVIETKLGYVDSSITTKLESLKKAVFDEVADEAEEETLDAPGAKPKK